MKRWLTKLTTSIGFTTIVALTAIACAMEDGELTPPPTYMFATEFPPATQAPPPTAATPAPTAKAGPRPPTPLPQIYSNVLPKGASIIPSLDRQIFSSDVIVLANFVSVAAGTETIRKAGEQPTYRPTITLTFNAVEYLKGSGPNTFSVELSAIGREQYWENGERYNGYLTKAKALEEAHRLVSARNTDYDDRPGVLFLKGPVATVTSSDGGDDGSTARTNYNFLLFNALIQGSFAVDVDSMSRAWLPYQSATGNMSNHASSVTTDNPTLITNSPPPSRIRASEDPDTMTLVALKTRIGEIAAMIAEGDGSEAYSVCIFHRLVRHEYYRGHTRSGNTGQFTLASGQPMGTELRKSPLVGNDAYNVYTTSGPAAAYFIVNILDDDVSPSNGYYYTYASARPLPVGEYRVNFHVQHHSYVICGFNPTHNNYTPYTVTVTAPAGALHEAFFDPTNNADHNPVYPASFTFNDTPTQITNLRWNDGVVTLTLNPHVSLSGYTLDFIALDGAASLTLPASNADSNPDAATLAWPVPDQPWRPGDKLMLRIRQDSAPPPPTPTP